MTKSVGIHEAKTTLSRLLDLVAAGEEVEITNRGRAVARLVPPVGERRRVGTAVGQIAIGADFDSPLPDDIVDAFGT